MSVYIFTNARYLTIIGFILGIIFSIIYMGLQSLPVFSFSFSTSSDLVSNWSLAAQLTLIITSISLFLLYIWSIYICIKVKNFNIISSLLPILYIMFVGIYKTDSFHLHHQFIGFVACFLIQSTSVIGEISHAFCIMLWISGTAIYGFGDIWTPIVIPIAV